MSNVIPLDLCFQIQQARNLPAADLNGKSDPYVECYVIDIKGNKTYNFRTKTIKGTLSPDWRGTRNEWRITVTPLQTVNFVVMDHDLFGKNDLLGTLKWEYQDFLCMKNGTRWFPLISKNGTREGELKINFMGGARAHVSREPLSFNKLVSDGLLNTRVRLKHDDVEALLKKINIYKSKKEFEAQFKELDVNGDGSLDFDEFSIFFERLCSRPAVIKLFHTFSSKTEAHMDPDTFLQFLRNHQKMRESTIDDAVKLISRFEKPIKGHQTKNLYISGFQNFICSIQENSIMNPKYLEQQGKLDRPLTEYFISSSHNTYLMGHQLSGISSVEGYVKALLRGFRCIELDCWGDNPYITHGFTFVSTIKFEDACETIRDYAFKISPYPVILSLEVHCSLVGQRKMAAILKNIFKEHLISPKDIKSKTPEDLKYKILLKAKNSKTAATAPAENDKPNKDQETVKEIATELSDLISIVCIPFNGPEDTPNDGVWQIANISEGVTDTFVNKFGSKFVEWNATHLTRVYPRGTRFGSSNFLPVKYWESGCQILALNCQTNCPSMWENDGLFQENGKTGYVLKPLRMRQFNVKSDPNALELRYKLNIKVIDGFHLPHDESGTDIIDPYIQVSISDPKFGQQTVQTKKIDDNGLNPIWNEEFTFNISDLEFVIITFVVWDEDAYARDDFIAFYSCRGSSIREGLRVVPLKDKNGCDIVHSNLLVQISFDKVG